MVEAITIVAIGAIYFTAYLISLYSLAVYIDPEEVEELYPNLPERQQAFFRRLVADPRAFMQIATVYKSLALIGVVILATYLLADLANHLKIDQLIIYPIGFLIIWLLQIFFVEYLARRRTRKTINEAMPRYLWLVSGIYVLLYPVVHIYRSALKRPSPDHEVSEEDKEDIIERAIETLADQAGIGETLVEEDEKEMIGHIFDLDQTVVKEIMVPRVDIVGIERSTSFKDIREIVKKSGHSRLPVYEQRVDEVIGILYVKDLISRMPEPGEKFKIESYLREPLLVPETKVIGQLLKEFQGRKQHMAIVADEYGGVAGLVTLEDIVEEVFGEIQDEHDPDEAEIVQTADYVWVVDAGLMVEKLQDLLDTDFDQGEHDSVGGLIYDLVGSVPEPETIIKWNDIRLKVIRVEGQRIVSVEVRYYPPRPQN